MKELVLVLVLVLLLSSSISAKDFTHNETSIGLWTKEVARIVSSASNSISAWGGGSDGWKNRVGGFNG